MTINNELRQQPGLIHVPLASDTYVLPIEVFCHCYCIYNWEQEAQDLLVFGANAALNATNDVLLMMMNNEFRQQPGLTHVPLA